MTPLLVTEDHPARRRAEAMVRAVYARAFGARIDRFPALMAAVLDERGVPRCAAGLRSTADGLFSERYLSVPAEQSISGAVGRPVPRAAIMEVTTLAAAEAGCALDLVRFAIEHGHRRGMRWGLCTVIAPLRRALAHAGLDLHLLAPASAERVPDPASWGSYYRRDPWVCAIPDPLAGGQVLDLAYSATERRRDVAPRAPAPARAAAGA